MRTRRKLKELEQQGFRDALVHGHMDPGKYEFATRDGAGGPAEEPAYRRGFEDGIRAVERIRSG